MRPITYVLIGMLNAQKTSQVRKLGQFSNLKSIPLDTCTHLRTENVTVGWISVIEEKKKIIAWQMEVDVASQNSLHQGFL